MLLFLLLFTFFKFKQCSFRTLFLRLNFPWKKLRDIVLFLFIYLNLHRQLFSPMSAHWFSPLIQKCIMGFIQFKWFENYNVSKWNTSPYKVNKTKHVLFFVIFSTAYQRIKKIVWLKFIVKRKKWSGMGRKCIWKMYLLRKLRVYSIREFNHLNGLIQVISSYLGEDGNASVWMVLQLV